MAQAAWTNAIMNAVFARFLTFLLDFAGELRIFEFINKANVHPRGGTNAVGRN
jgi:hypothetical protein